MENESIDSGKPWVFAVSLPAEYRFKYKMASIGGKSFTEQLKKLIMDEIDRQLDGVRDKVVEQLALTYSPG